MAKDGFDAWIEINTQQICEENDIVLKDYKDWQRHRFFIFEEISRRFENQMADYLKKANEAEEYDNKEKTPKCTIFSSGETESK